MPPEPTPPTRTDADATFEHLFGVPVYVDDDWDIVFTGVVFDGVSHYIVCDFIAVGSSDVVPAEHALRPFLDRFAPPIVPNMIAFDDALDGTLPYRRYLGAPEPEWGVWVRGIGAPQIAFEAW